MKRSPLPLHMLLAYLFFLHSSFNSCTKDTELLAETFDVVSSDDAQIESETEPDSETETESDSDAVETVVDNDVLATENAAETQTLIEPIYHNTEVSISGNQFFINGKPTYEGRYWQGNKIEGLLMNSRMVQGIFDDLNITTSSQFSYPDTDTWNADRNTDEFVNAMPSWKNNGLLAFTLNMQGGSPTGYGNAQPWVNSAFDSQGDLRPAYMSRLKRILDKANELEMVVILGYFYFGQDEELADETAVIHAVDNITDWILDEGYRNILIEINNEADVSYDHDILKPQRVHELIKRVQQKEKDGFRLLVSTSFSGSSFPSAQVAIESNYILFHGNGVVDPSIMSSLLQNLRSITGVSNKPIIVNEDDHYDFDAPNNNFKAAVENYVSWGYFDFRREGDSYEDGYQSVPIDWGINSDRKRAFFSKVKEITGY